MHRKAADDSESRIRQRVRERVRIPDALWSGVTASHDRERAVFEKLDAALRVDDAGRIGNLQQRTRIARISDGEQVAPGPRQPLKRRFDDRIGRTLCNQPRRGFARPRGDVALRRADHGLRRTEFSQQRALRRGRDSGNQGKTQPRANVGVRCKGGVQEGFGSLRGSH